MTGPSADDQSTDGGEVVAMRSQIASLERERDERVMFVRMMAHELSNPLMPMNLQLSILTMQTEEPLSLQQQKAVAIVQRNLERLSGLISDFVDATQMQAKQLSLKKTRLDLDAHCGEFARDIEGLAAEHGVALTVHLRSGAEVMADGHRLTQVLLNLGSNAIKFTPPGGRVVMSTESRSGDVILQVKDTGAGLTEEQILKLFQPFSRVHGFTKVEKPGTGLGLYISKGIIEQHGGRMWAESAGPGNGSTFCFAIPLAPNANTDR